MPRKSVPIIAREIRVEFEVPHEGLTGWTDLQHFTVPEPQLAGGKAAAKAARATAVTSVVVGKNIAALV